ncbi:unnamed protein product [Notodromas monacha]|uniref:Neurexin-4 n=1 Tax=Notodromas monacha TaxID=399045 RepID=A0A7R9BW97_9CRUS|nr:unnamed protein product [Notodromas monacha]CAG0922962.1 unnamed protein product [Notodromas monacha]
MEYMISYGSNGLDFAYYRGFDGSPKTFKGNTDSNSLYVNIFDPPIVAQWIRINPTRWQDRISMRLELYGCTYNPDPKAVGLDGVTYFERRVGEDRERYDRPIEFLSYDHPLLRDEIRFRFKTNEADGVILYGWGKQNDILAVQLVDNRLFLNVGLGGRELTSLSVGSLLDDGIWHDVFISRDKRSVTLSVDRVVVSKSIQGNFQRLNIDFAWYVAGVPSKKRGLDTIRHFKGCLESLYINRHNFFTENPWRPDQAWLIVRESAQASVNSNSIGYDNEPAFVRHDKFMSDIRRQLCNEQQIVPVTFLTSESHVKLKGYEALESLSISFEFRTFEMEGTLVYHKFYSDGYVKNKMVSDLDFRPVETVREMDIKTGAYYYFAGGMKGSKGFIGCMKSIVVDGNNQFPLNWGTEEKPCCQGELLLDACRMFDRCSPNPCEHGGRCIQNSERFTCECENTGYTGAVCHVPRYSHSCAAHFQANPGEMKKSIEIDVDGSGPLTPFPVTCTLNEDEVYTTVERKTRGAIRFSEESGPERIHYPVEYDAGLDEMDLLIDRSVACEQHVAYTCKNGAPLFGQDSERVSNNLGSMRATNREYFPIQWFSRINKPMDYWGGAIPNSKSCFCGMYDSCQGGGMCNCDPKRSVQQRPSQPAYPGGPLIDPLRKDEFKNMDEGYLRLKEDLPLSAVSGFLRGATNPGATGTGPKEGIVSIGDLVCRGDTLAHDVVTFRVPDATLDFPAVEWGQSGDIYFEFRTTTHDAVLIHSRGVNGDFIKVSIIGGDHLQFEYQAGAGGALAVNIETQHKIADDRWHSLRVERNRLEARMVLDEAISQAQSNNNGPEECATVDWRDGFVGCMRSLMVNGRQLKMNEMLDKYEIYGVTSGCIGKCDSNPCLNNGTCLEGYDKYICDCQWTAFKGPICADEIGVNMMNDYMIKYSFQENYKSTLNEYIRVGFTTTNPQGFLLGLSSDSSKEYLTLMVSNSGHLRVVFDFGFERQEFIFPDHMFNAGQFHDVTFMRRNSGTEMVIKVDNYQPMVRKLQISGSADAQFNNINNFYIGKNESMTAGFIGCIARVQFDDIFPLKLMFQQDAPENIRTSHADIHEDFCGIEPVTHPPEEVETRPPPVVDRAKVREFTQNTDSAVLGAILGAIFLALVVMAIVILRLRTRDMGEYMTQEDEGAREAFDADEAVVKSATGPRVQKRKEWFI